MEEEEQLLRKIHGIHILKTGHHGSDSSTGMPLLDAAKPDVAIISCGRNNSYGHPGKETLKRLSAVPSRVLVTARTGAIKITIGKHGYQIETYCGE